MFDAILTDFWRILDVPLFPIKQDPFWRISDAFLTHFWRISDAFWLLPTPFPKDPFFRSRLGGREENGLSKNIRLHDRFPTWRLLRSFGALWLIPITRIIGRREKTPTPKTRFSIWTLLRPPGPLYYKTPPCAIYHKNGCSKAVFGP